MDKATPNYRIFSLASNLSFIALNLMLVIAIFVAVVAFDSLWLAIGMVLLAKWRVFATRLRFWWVNILSNGLDFLVGVGFVCLIFYLNNFILMAQLMVAGLYLIWLLLIKPASSQKMIMIQGLIGTFLLSSMMVLFMANWHSVWFVIGAGIVAYLTAYHFTTNADFDKKSVKIISGAWALVMAETAWIFWHWIINYHSVAGLKIPQFALVASLLTFLFYKVVIFSSNDEVSNPRALVVDLLASVVFVVSLLLLLVLFFSKPIVLNN